jgi:hypothetical protein
MATGAWAADVVMIEDWAAYPVGHRGFPGEWGKPDFASSHPDATIVEHGGRKVVHLKSAGDSSYLARKIEGRVNLRETPILEWSWKVTTLPKGADARRAETDDEAAQVYVTWPRFPAAVRSRHIGYIWDSTAPAGAIFQSKKTGQITYVVVRSGTADVGKWLTERRNVYEDFKQIYGEEPESPGAISFGIDSDDVKGTAESHIGALLFRRP